MVSELLMDIPLGLFQICVITMYRYNYFRVGHKLKYNLELDTLRYSDRIASIKCGHWLEGKK